MLQILLALWLGPAQLSADPGAVEARKTAYARIPLAQRIASDPNLIEAVEAKNASGESDAGIRHKDEEWQANPRHPLRAQLVSGPCADTLRQHLADDPVVVEAFLMDARGALVCTTHETSDYWQGDETKWLKTYNEGKAFFIDEPSLDASTGIYAVQLSAPIAARGHRIGALTLTLKVPR